MSWANRRHGRSLAPSNRRSTYRETRRADESSCGCADSLRQPWVARSARPFFSALRPDAEIYVRRINTDANAESTLRPNSRIFGTSRPNHEGLIMKAVAP